MNSIIIQYFGAGDFPLLATNFFMQDNPCYLSGVNTFVRAMDCKDVGGDHTDWVH